jgi:diketogulonate reductase-like aldo/keto reductase
MRKQLSERERFGQSRRDAMSTHRERITENAQLFDFRLSDEEIAELDALDRTGGTDRALERTWWRS